MIGNIKPVTDPYHELENIQGNLYHKNTNAWLKNAVNYIFGTNYVPQKMYSIEEETLNDGIRLGAEFAVVDGVFRLAKVLGRSLWELEPFRRGFVYEKALNLKGAFRTSNFPVIDAFYKGVATSIKTLDIRAKSYLKGNAVFNQLKNI